MKILMLTPYLPYPDSSGGQIRTLNLLKHLYKEHKITLVSLIKDKKDNKYKKHLLKYCDKVLTFERSKNPFTLKNILLAGFSLKPFLIVRNSAPGVKEAVAEELKTGDYDLIHAETFYVMPSIPQTDLPVILVDQTIEYLVYKHYTNETARKILRPLLSIDVAKLQLSEKRYWKKADQVVAVSENDKKEMRKLVPDLDVKVVPNGVNLDLFKKKTSWFDKNPTILFVSNFKWLQNIEAAHVLIEKVFPLVKAKNPKVKVRIVGQHIPKDIVSQASDSIIIDDIPGEDVKTLVEAYQSSTVFASTIKGPGGTRLKNLAAMASQLPIVSTKTGIQGLGAKDGVHVLIGNTPEKLADLILKVIKQPKLAEKIGKNSRKLVEETYAYKRISKILSQCYRDMVKK